MPLSPVAVAGALALAYLIGSIPFCLILGKVVGRIDIREHGSKNVGATNVTRLLGWRWGAMALALDALKGLVPTLLIPKAFEEPRHVAVGCGVAAILGHMFSCFLKFKGGKGVATSLGVVSVLAPVAALSALGTFIVLFAWKRIVSLGSIVAAVVFAAVQMWRLLPRPFEAHWSLAAFSLAVPALVIFRHRANIGRLLRGEEKALHPVGAGGATTTPTPGPIIRPDGNSGPGTPSQSLRGEASSRPL